MFMSSYKDKVGHLEMRLQDETESDETWQGLFFLIQDGIMYWFRDSKSSRPSGFAVLQYASVELDTKFILSGQWVINVCTPFRTLQLRAKHAVALAEWTTVIERIILQRDEKGNKKTTTGLIAHKNDKDKTVNDHESRVKQLLKVQYTPKWGCIEAPKLM